MVREGFQTSGSWEVLEMEQGVCQLLEGLKVWRWEKVFRLREKLILGGICEERGVQRLLQRSL